MYWLYWDPDSNKQTGKKFFLKIKYSHFHTKKKLIDFAASGPALKNTVEDVLQTEEKWGLRRNKEKLKWSVSSVQFSHSVMSDSLRPHESQHARPPCPSPSPRVHSDSRPSSPWCHPAISSSVVPFSSCPESLPASESFPMSQLFAWGGQSVGVSALASFLPKKSQGWSPSEWTGWISLENNKCWRGCRDKETLLHYWS